VIILDIRSVLDYKALASIQAKTSWGKDRVSLFFFFFFFKEAVAGGRDDSHDTLIFPVFRSSCSACNLFLKKKKLEVIEILCARFLDV
jgi:hypothetical protein